ncbi:MAG: methionyl-tRNA formyltransferase [Candidatus Marinimicrobia bacterium]|nr:methionyl-tRNA formyltransferase [Candidatus Neomarinimicrobiota bacterium]
MKLVFFGTPEFAVPTLDSLHDSDHDILGVVTSPDKKSGRGLKIQSSAIKKSAEKYGLPIYQPESTGSKQLQSILTQINPDIYVVVAYKILPELILNIPRRGAVNLHASLLPKYRGAAPVNHAILNGETEIGLTTFLIQKKVDTGDLLLQRSFDMDNSITTGEALSKLSFIGADLVIKTLNALSQNKLNPIKQNNDKATFAPKISVQDCKINWNKPASMIHNKIRAFSPKPGAFTFYKNKRVKLFGSKVLQYLPNSKLLPGQIEYADSIFKIGTDTEPIQITNIQIEGKKKLQVSEFILGYPKITGGYFD